MASKTTKHTCGGPSFGRKTPGCPRCDELLAGAEPVVWNTRRDEITREQRRFALDRHFASGDHKNGCRVTCTFGDW